MSSSSRRGLRLSPGHWLAHGLGDAKPTKGRFLGNTERSCSVNRSMETAGPGCESQAFPAAGEQSQLKGTSHNSHPGNSHIPGNRISFVYPVFRVIPVAAVFRRGYGPRLHRPDTTTALKSDASSSEQAFYDLRNVFGEPGEEDREMCPTIQSNDTCLSESAELRQSERLGIRSTAELLVGGRRSGRT
jgi:hypothetical protein